MRAVIQRVAWASVTVENQVVGKIGQGLCILLGIEETDNDSDLEWLVTKINGLRIFRDQNHAMNLSVHDINGELLVISQFTLYASTKKGNRPSFLRSAKPEFAKLMVDKCISQLAVISGKQVATGVFGADMKVELLNDGPVTITIDTKEKE